MISRLAQTTGRGPERSGLSTPGSGVALRPPETGRADRLLAWLAGSWAAELLLGVTAALWFGFRVWRPSPWWDEAITRDVTSRSASQILDLAEHIDLVHTTYYLIVHALLGQSASVTPIRLISVAAAALTAALLVRLGRELDAPRVGVVAAAAWIVAPLATRYAQEARPYAMVALAATAATLALVRVCRKPWRPGRWVAYSAAVVATGLLNVLSLLIVAVHLGYVLATSSPAVRRRWYLAAGGALALLAPLLYASTRQREQVSWLPRPQLVQLSGFFRAEYGVGAVALVLLLVAIAGLGRGTHAPALALGLSWAALPPVILWTISQAHPLFDWRYVFFTVPGAALALGSLATLVRLRWLVVALAVLAIGGAHMQNVYRYWASGHSENIRGAAAVIAQNARPGDAVLFLPESRRVVKLGYPDAFRAVDDVALAESAQDSATLWGIEDPADELAAALHERYRVWVVTGVARYGETPTATTREKERLLYDGFRVAGVTTTGRYEVRLYERDRAAADAVSTPAS